MEWATAKPERCSEAGKRSRREMFGIVQNDRPVAVRKRRQTLVGAIEL